MSYNNLEKRNIIMEHYTNPNFKKETIVKENKTIKYGETCADYLEFDYEIKNNKITNLHFSGAGCAFFIASTDILCSYLNNMEIDQAINFIGEYEKILNAEILEKDLKENEIINVFYDVKKHYNRLNCCLMLVRPLKKQLLNEN